MLYLSLPADFEWIEENTTFIYIYTLFMLHVSLLKADLNHTKPFAHYWVWFCKWVLICVKFSA